MFVQATRNAVLALVLSGFVFSAGDAAAEVPGPPITQDVVYKMHSNPDDPNSPIIFTIWLSLEQADQDDDSVGWEVTEVRFRQIAEGSGADTIWMASDPNVPTSDGLWWVDHADRSNPQLAEFDVVPYMAGTAAAEDPNDPDLEYSFEGATYTPPGGGPPWDPTTALNYSFSVDGDPAPVQSDEDEPVEIDDDDDPPMQ
jgi:hypothetical protein